MPHLRFYAPGAQVVIDDRQSAVVESVTIQKMSWDLYDIEYLCEWWETWGKTESTVGSYRVTSGEMLIETQVGFEEHPSGIDEQTGHFGAIIN
jgi:hypothetical protein